MVTRTGQGNKGGSLEGACKARLHGRGLARVTTTSRRQVATAQWDPAMLHCTHKPRHTKRKGTAPPMSTPAATPLPKSGTEPFHTSGTPLAINVLGY